MQRVQTTFAGTVKGRGVGGGGAEGVMLLQRQQGADVELLMTDLRLLVQAGLVFSQDFCCTDFVFLGCEMQRAQSTLEDKNTPPSQSVADSSVKGRPNVRPGVLF